MERRRSLTRAHAAGRLLPLSPYQRDVWLAQTVTTEASQFQIGGYVDLGESVDRALLVRSVEHALEQNEALHFRVTTVAGTFQQWVERRGAHVNTVDWSDAGDPVQAAQRFMVEDFPEKLPVDSGPLYKLAVVSAGERTFLYAKVHHFVADGFSLSILFEQILERYLWARAEGDPLERVAVQKRHAMRPRPAYSRAAKAMDAYIESADFARDKAHFATYLDGASPALFAPPPASGRRTERITRTLDLSYGGTSAPRGPLGSNFSLVAAALGIYLMRVHRTREVMIGVPYLNRRAGDERRTVGHFANILPLRIVDSGKPAVTLVSEISSAARRTALHQRFPQGDLGPVSGGHGRLFDVSLSYQREVFSTDTPGLSFTSLSPNQSPMALSVFVREDRSGQAVVDIDYATDIFDEDFSVESMFRHITAIVGALQSGDTDTVRSLPFLAPDEVRTLLQAAEGPSHAEGPADTLIDRFEANARRTPEALALSAPDGALTYAELDAEADALASVLRAAGIGEDDRVAVLMDRCLSMMVALFAVLKAGAAYVPIDPGYPPERIRFMLADSEPKGILSRRGLIAKVFGPETPPCALFCVDELDLSTPGTKPERTPGNRHLAYVLYTSGSTGQPKGTMIEHRSVQNRLDWMQDRYPIGPGSVLLQKTPISFDVSVWELFWWATVGATLAILPAHGEKDPGQIVRCVEANGVSVLHFVPSMLGPMLDHLENDPSAAARFASVRQVFTSGEALLPPLAKRFYELVPTARLTNLYGPTEATVDVSYYDVPNPPEARIPIGRPVQSTRLLVLDSELGLMPAGAPGELCIGGIQVARGYFRRPELSLEKFVADPYAAAAGDERATLYRTGDLCRLLATGDIEYLGRMDGQVKIRGNRVELLEVQHVLSTFPGVRDAVVVDEQRADRGTVLVAYYVRHEAAAPNALRAHLARTLPDFMIPSHFILLSALPLGPSGKVDRKQLPKPEHTPTEGTLVEYKNPIEEKLANIWRQVLGVWPIAPSDDYFALGGDSLLMLRVCALAQREGIRIGIGDIFEAPTIAALAVRAAQIRSETDLGRSALPHSVPFEGVADVDREHLASAVDAFPATKLQLGMLYHSLASAQSRLYKDVFSYHIRTDFDEPRMRAAVLSVIARNPSLRSNFSLATEGPPLQVVWPDARPGIFTVCDLRHLPPKEADDAVVAFAEAATRLPYDPEHGALFLLTVHRLQDEVVLTASFHHAIVDGLSVATILSQIFAAYDGKSLAPRLVDSALRDYAWAEQRAQKSEASRAFFLEHLRDAPMLDLSGDRAFVAEHQGSQDGAVRAECRLDRALEEDLQKLARQEGVSQKHVMLAAHVLVLAHLSGESCVVTGVVTHGRPTREGADDATGLFLNTLPYRVSLGELTMRGLIAELREQEARLHKHRRYPLASILDDRGGRPAFDAAFNFVHFHVLSVAARSLVVLGYSIRERTNIPLFMTVARHPADERLTLRIDGVGARFTQGYVEQVATVFQTALQMLVATPDARARLAAPGSPRRVPGGAPQATPFWELFKGRAMRSRDALAVTGHGGRLSYGDLFARATGVASGLVRLGAERSDRVALLVRRSADWVATTLGVLALGATCVPLDRGYPKARLRSMVEIGRPRYLVCDSDSMALAHELRAGSDSLSVVEISDLLRAPSSPEVPGPLADTIAYILFTSGSTGQPKGVCFPHRALDNLIAFQLGSILGRTEEGRAPRTLAYAPTSFDVSFQELCATLAGGGTLVLMDEDERADMARVLDVLLSYSVERIFLPYVALQALCETAVTLGRYPGSLRIVISSGEQLRITDAIRTFFQKTSALLQNQYGPTETHVVTSHTLKGSPDQWPALPPIGSPIPGATLRVVDGAGESVLPPAVGELAVSGRCVALGYFERPDLSAAKFLSRPECPNELEYRTGDRVMLLANAELAFLGRRDTQVKIRGHRVELLEVELALRHLGAGAGFADVAVVDVALPRRDVELVACLVPGQSPASQTDISLVETLRRELPPYMVPSRILRFASIPRTPSGKRDDAVLRDQCRSAILAQQEPQPGAHVATHADGVESLVLELMREELLRGQLSPTDCFFDHGGSSLSAMRLSARLGKRFGKEVPLSLFVTHSTARQLAEYLRKGDHASSIDPIVPIRTGGEGKPLFLVHPIGGSALAYVRLAPHISPNRPIYALSAPGLDVGQTPLASIPELAVHYLSALARIQPDGPYLLGGWSFGGHVAFEMGRQLLERGERASHVLLIDSIALQRQNAVPVSTHTMFDWFVWELLWTKQSHEGGPSTPPGDLTLDQKIEFACSEAIRHGILPEGAATSWIVRLFSVFEAHFRALLAYDPEPTDLPVTLIRAESPLPNVLLSAHSAAGSLHGDAKNGWARHTRGPIDVVGIAGDHLQIMEYPYIETLGMELSTLIDAAAGPYRASHPRMPNRHQ